jgi:Na+/H+ antiporter NhaD/arsenite permease-like protein
MEFRRRVLLVVMLGLLFGPDAAKAAPMIDGTQMGWGWTVPFAGILFSIAAGPLLFPRVWHQHYGKIAAGWAVASMVPLAIIFGINAAVASLIHIVLADYVSFIVLLFALYTVGGGLLVTGELGGTPLTNTLVLAFGTLIASLVGTTGAAMILVRPLIRANAERPYKAHVIVFFIFLVGNIGGALSPLGDPPLLVGFLHGVDFLWPARHLWKETLLAAMLVLGVFLALDAWHRRHEAKADSNDKPLRVYGLLNLPLLGGIVAVILLSSVWQPNAGLEVYGTVLQLQNLVRDLAVIAIALLSLWLTPEEHRAANDFSWEPIREVAKLFAAIFICIIPVVAMLQAGYAGPAAPLLAALNGPDGTPNNEAYFWLTGILSAFLDNAPTYLIFFQLAGGNAFELMNEYAPTLASISMGAVYLGALTYVGNAPNLMVCAIAEERGVKMPSFFGYILRSVAVLVPIFVLLRWIFGG